MGPMKDVSASFAEGTEIQSLLEQGYVRAAMELGSLWYRPEQITLQDRVHVRMLGTPEAWSLFVRGARAI